MRVPGWGAFPLTMCVLLLASCSDNGGASAPTATVSKAKVTATLAQASSYIPGCRSLVAPAAVRANAIQALMAALVADRPPATRDRPSTQSGTCASAPGSLNISKAHANGISTFTVTFNNLCVLDAATGEKSTISGTGTVTDVGTPSASGPIVSSQTVETGPQGLTFVRRKADGTAVVDSKVVVHGLTQTYGVPAAFAPGDPTAAHPNTVKVDSIVRVDNLRNETTTFSNVNGSYFTSPTSGTWTVAIAGGRMQSGTHGTIDFATPAASPIVIGSGYKIESGAVTVTGAGGAAAVFTAVSGQPNKFTVQVAGQPLDASAVHVDCGTVSLAGIVLGT